MARMPRHKSTEAAFYHLTNRVAGAADFFPLHEPEACQEFQRLFLFYVRGYFCRLASLEVMGNHYHSVIHFERYRKLSRKELAKRARYFYGRKTSRKTARWTDDDWQTFNDRLFDVSKLMQNIQGEFAKWYNRRYRRRGHFWAGRFKSSELLDLEAVQECVLYSDLNAFRAGLVARPEDWEAGSAHWRCSGQDQDLIPLSELFPEAEPGEALSYYRARLYHRGAVATKEGHAVIPESVLAQEQERGWGRPGLYRQRCRFWSDGLAVGSRQSVRPVLLDYHEQGYYKTRNEPIAQLEGRFFSLRSQRPKLEQS